jgi:hypothetical protein
VEREKVIEEIYIDIAHALHLMNDLYKSDNVLSVKDDYKYLMKALMLFLHKLSEEEIKTLKENNPTHKEKINMYLGPIFSFIMTEGCCGKN